VPLLSPDHFTRLVEALFECFDDRDDLEVFLKLKLGRELSRLSKDAELDFMLMKVVKHADQAGWLPDLLDKAVAKFSNNLALQALRAELIVPNGAVPGNPWSVCMIRGDQAFIDRRDLRDHMCELEKPGGRRILIVKGEERTGKSYTRQFVTHRVDTIGERPIVIDLAELHRNRRGERVMPDDVARSLCNLLGIAPGFVLAKEDEQYARWSLDFCQRLSGHLANWPTRVWIIVDEFNSVVLPESTLGLFNQLATHVESMMTQIRLVLLGYGKALPPIEVDEWAYQEEALPISDEELLKFFRQIYASRRAIIDENDVVTSTALVWTRIQATDPFRNKAIGCEAAIEARRILKS
jgi:hypothetical protein